MSGTIIAVRAADRSMQGRFSAHGKTIGERTVDSVSEHVRLSLSEWNELYLYLPVSEHVRLTTRVG